jgi:hypothetical protein
MKHRSKITRVCREFAAEALHQLFGWVSPHEGTLVLTTSATIKMHEWQLDAATLQDAFRFGEHTNKGDKVQVVRQYQNYSVGLWYKVVYTPAHPNIPSVRQYLVITCWKGGGRYVRL